MPAPFFPNASCFEQAADLQTKLALSELNLFLAGFEPTVETTAAELLAQVANYTGYAPAVVTAFLDPISAPGGGAQITAPTEQFALAATPAAGASIGGWWLETATGEVILIKQFDDPVPMMEAGDAVQITPTIRIPNGIE